MSDMINSIHTLLSNVTMSLLSAISYENALPRMEQSSMRVPHNTGCDRYNKKIFFFTVPNYETDIPILYTVKAYCPPACSFFC